MKFGGESGRAGVVRFHPDARPGDLTGVLMPAVLALLAQAPAVGDVSAGTFAGWTATTFLGAMLYWLAFHHLPGLAKRDAEKDKQHAAALAEKDEQLAEARKEYTAALGAAITVFRAENRDERLACEKHFETLAGSMNQAFTTVGTQLTALTTREREHSERNRQYLELLRKQLDERAGKPPPMTGPRYSPEPERDE